MGIRYYKLFDMLNRRGMSKTELRTMASIGTATLAKLNKGESVTMDVVSRICAVLDCQPGDICEYVPDARDSAKGDDRRASV